jgi:hypothetical protein
MQYIIAGSVANSRSQRDAGVCATWELCGDAEDCVENPDTLRQDRGVLTRIVRELDGKMALDCTVLQGGLIREGDPVILRED